MTLVVPESGVPTPRGASPHGCPAGRRDADRARPVDPAEAAEFLDRFRTEVAPHRPRGPRLRAVLDEIDRTGSYTHTSAELAFGAKVAWRNAARCIGRLYWNSLRVRDRRHLHEPADVADECVAHLRDATRAGRIRSTITVFAPRTPASAGPLIHNDQLIRYAGHHVDGSAGDDRDVRGDRGSVALTDRAVALGWRRPDPPGRFDVLPLLVSDDGGVPELFTLPSDAVLEVELTHPEHDRLADLQLRWYAVPAISNMPLEVGGVTYPVAPFNGWYMATEIGVRNLVDPDRYDLLPAVAEHVGLSTGSDRTLWRDRAVLELLRAVQHSFDAAGVTVSDHHTESGRFLVHVAKEERAGRSCPAEWSWIVPPVSGSLTPVFHRYYDHLEPGTRPAFLSRGSSSPGVEGERTGDDPHQP